MSALRKIHQVNNVSSYQGQPVGLFEAFKENAEKIGSEVYVAKDAAEAAKIIEKILKEIKPRRVVAASSPLVNRLNLENISLLHITSKNLEIESKCADVGIFGAKLAIAETGSIGQVNPTMDERRVSSLTDTSIAIVDADDLMQTFREAMESVYNNSNAPDYLSFITGPSRTSDIERVLTIGVHGPRRMIVVLIAESTGGKSNGNKTV